MYNGIGLQTARGSGTNGYVQTNKFFVRPKSSKLVDSSKGFGPDQGTAGIARKPNRDILEHDRKRQIELKLTILEDKLSDQGYTESEIVDKLNEARASLEAADAASYGDGVNPIFANEKNVSDTQTHQIAARKEKQLETMRAALGISLPEDKEEKRHGLVDLDAHEDNDEKPRNYKKGGSQGDGEYEEGEILHRNEDGEAKLQRHEENLVSERKFDAKGRKSDRSIKDEDDYLHKKGQIRKHTDKKSRRAHSSTDTESDSMHSRDSALGTKGKQRAQRKSKKSETSGSDNSASDSDDSGDARRKRRGQERHVRKHKKNEQKKTQGRKKEISESSDSDTESEKARETDSDTETRRKHSYEKSKMIKSKSRDYSDHSSDGLEEKHKKGRQVKLVKSHKRRDSDELDLEIKTRHASEKSKTLKSQVNSDTDHTSDDSDREPERWGSKKFEEGHKRQASERDCNVEIKTKYRDGKSERSKPAIIDASDYSSDDSRRERQRREAHHKMHKSDKDNDTRINQKSRSEKPSTVKPKVNSDSDSDNYQKEREYQRKSGQFEKAHRSRDVDNVRALSPEVQDVNRHVKRGRHDSEEDDSDGKLKSQRSEAIRARYDDKERKDDRRGQNRDDEYKRKHVEAADNRDYMGQRRDTSKSDDRELSGGRNEDVDYRKKQDRSMHGHKHRRDTSRSGDREVSGGRQEDVDYRKKQDRSVHELAHRRHRQDGREHADRVPGDDQSRGQRRDEKEFERKREYENDYKRHRREDEDGNQRRGRREEDDDGRRQEMERESSKRTRYEDSSTGDRRHHDRVDFSEDRWR